MGGDLTPALKDGKSYTSEAVGTLGPTHVQNTNEIGKFKVLSSDFADRNNFV